MFLLWHLHTIVGCCWKNSKGFDEWLWLSVLVLPLGETLCILRLRLFAVDQVSAISLRYSYKYLRIANLQLIATIWMGRKMRSQCLSSVCESIILFLFLWICLTDGNVLIQLKAGHRFFNIVPPKLCVYNLCMCAKYVVCTHIEN